MILTAKWVLPVSTEPLREGAVVIKGEKIEAVGKEDKILTQYPREEVKDLGAVILLPGLVNLHTHLDYTILRGENDNLPFLPWVSNLVNKSRQLEFAETLISAKLGGLELLASGITTIADTTAGGASLQAVAELGLRGIVYQEVFGMDDKKLDSILSAVQEKYERLKANANERLNIGLSPHAPYSVSGRLLQELHNLAQNKEIPLCMHLAETKEEMEFLVEGSGPLATTYRESVGWGDIPWKAPGVSAVKYLDKLGVLSENLLTVHLAQTKQEDMQLLSEAGVKVAYCPKSNAKLGAGIANLPAMLESGLQVGLGSDSAASNNSLDLFSEMEFGLLIQRANQKRVEALVAQEIVKMATIQGARILNLEKEIGTLEPGKQADLIAVKIDNPVNQPVYDPYSALVYTASSRDVVLTILGGEIMYREGKFTEQIDQEAIQVRAKEIQEKIIEL